MKFLPYSIPLLLTALALGAPWLAPYAPEQQFRDSALQAPSEQFWLGTDELGRDRYSRLLYAGRWSLLAGTLATGVCLAVGTLLGSLAGIRGGIWAGSLNWLGDLALSLPWLYLLFAVRALLPLQLPNGLALVLILLLVGLLGWPGPARLIAASAHQAWHSDTVRCSRALGARGGYLVRRHLLPQLGQVLRPQCFILLPQFVLAETTLSFFGLGLAEPTPTWGSLLAELRDHIATGWHWWELVPLAPIALLSFSASTFRQKLP